VSLTKEQVAEYREKLRDKKYIEQAISSIADDFSTNYVMVKPIYTESEINNTEGKNGEKHFE
jgi:hypothetical protein